MCQSQILYDIRKDKYPDQRGDAFRSLQVFECYVCGAVTNRVVMGGCFGYGVRAVCPNAAEDWHHVIEDKLRLTNKPHPASYLQELAAEIATLRAQHAAEIKNDIEGEPDQRLKEPVTNTRAYKC